MSQYPPPPQPGYNTEYAGAPTPGTPIGQPIQAGGAPSAQLPHPNTDPSGQQHAQGQYLPPGGPPPGHGQYPQPPIPLGQGQYPQPSLPQGQEQMPFQMPSAPQPFPGADPSQQAYHPGYYAQTPQQHQDPLWYLGTAIPDPNGPRAPMGVLKVPGYDPAKDYKAIQEGSLQKAKNYNPTLISTLPKLSVFEMDALDDYFTAKLGKTLPDFVETTTTDYFAMALRGLALGPLGFDVELARKATQGFGTKENLLTELILGRESAEIRLLITGYRIKYGRSLLNDVSNDLSGPAQRMFKMALGAQRPPYNFPVDHKQAEADAQALRQAAAGRGVNDVVFFEILINRSQPHIREVIRIYNQEFKSLSKVIKKEFSGHVRQGLLHIVHGAKPKRDGTGVFRDAKLLEESMKGLGTKDKELVWRVLRGHWSPSRMQEIKAQYLKRYGKALEDRVKGETSGPYRDLLIAIIQSSGKKN